MSSDALTGRRKKVKLGMTVEAPKKPGPYDKLGRLMEQGATAEDKLEARGRRMAGRQAAKTQSRIPKATPSFKKRGARA